MRPIASGRSRCNRYAVILFGSRFGRRSDAILGSYALPSSTSQHLADNDTTPCSCAPATAVRHNSIIDSPASSGLWTFQESWTTSCQQKRLGSVLPQHLTDHFATRVSPYITTLHTCREHTEC